MINSFKEANFQNESIKANRIMICNNQKHKNYVLTDLIPFFFPPFCNITLGLKQREEVKIP